MYYPPSILAPISEGMKLRCCTLHKHSEFFQSVWETLCIFSECLGNTLNFFESVWFEGKSHFFALYDYVVSIIPRAALLITKIIFIGLNVKKYDSTRTALLLVACRRSCSGTI